MHNDRILLLKIKKIDFHIPILKPMLNRVLALN